MMATVLFAAGFRAAPVGDKTSGILAADVWQSILVDDRLARAVDMLGVRELSDFIEILREGVPGYPHLGHIRAGEVVIGWMLIVELHDDDTSMAFRKIEQSPILGIP